MLLTTALSISSHILYVIVIQHISLQSNVNYGVAQQMH